MKAALLCFALLFFARLTYAQSIELDKIFGDNGILEKRTTEKGNFLYDAMDAFAELESKKLLGAIFHDNRSYLSRINEDGSTDVTYQNGGYSEPYLLEKTRLLKAKDGTLFWVGMQLASPKGISIYKLQRDGTIDQTFGNKGMVSLNAGLRTEWLMDALIQADGKLLLLQSAPHNNTPGKNIIYRFLTNGELDKSFGSDGAMTIDILGVTHVWGIGVQKNRLIVGIKTSHRIGVAGYYLNGNLDWNFGLNGITMTQFTSYGSSNKLVVQPNGIIYVTTITHRPHPLYVFRVFRLTANGRYDATIDRQGKGLIEFTTPITISKIVLDQQSRMFITGTQTHAPGKVTPMIIKLQSYGHVHYSFGVKGVANADTLAEEVAVNDALFLSDGSIATVGYLNQPIRDFKDPDYPGRDSYFISKTDTLGKPIKQFSSNGIAAGFVPRSGSEFADLKPAADKSSLFASYATRADKLTRSYTNILLNGRIDSSFGNDGFIPTNASGSKYGLTAQGKVVVLSIEGQNLVLQRYTSKGLLDDSFGVGGKKIPVSFSEFYYSDFIINPAGSMFISGSFTDTSDDRYRQKRFIIKLTEQGDLDGQFGTNGMLTFSEKESFSPLHLLLQPDDKIVAYGMKDFDSIPNTVMILRRFLQDGTTDTKFGVNGVAREDFKESFYPHKIQRMPNGSFLTEYHYSNEFNVFNHALVKYDSQGNKLMNFGVSGMLLNPEGVFHPLEDNRILKVKHPIGHEPNVLSLSVYDSNGMLDRNFGNAGTTRILLPLEISSFHQIVKAGDRFYITGFVKDNFDSREIIIALKITPEENDIVSSFTLINSKTDKDVQELQEGDEIDLATIPGNVVNIRANTTANIGSLVMKLSGAQSKTVTENIAPYALFGDTLSNNYRNWTPTVGTYTLTATPYSKAKGKGEAGAARTINFKVVYNLTLSHLTLVNAKTNKDITTLTNGAVIDLAKSPQINIRANTGKGFTESVRFDVDSGQYRVIESHKPFALATDNKGDYLDWMVTPGTYTITATPYGVDGGKGLTGIPMMVTITIVDTRKGATKVLATTRQKNLGLTEAKSLQLTTYPNPAVSSAVAEFSVPKTTSVNLVVVDASGKVVQQVYRGVADGGMVYRKSLNTSTLPTGLYFCYLTTADGRTKVTRLIKQ